MSSDNKMINQEQYNWNPFDIFPDWEAWDEAMNAIEGPMEALDSFNGRLTSSPQALRDAYQTNDTIQTMLYKLYCFPMLMFDTNQKDNDIRSRVQRVSALLAEMTQRYSWMTPELLNTNESIVLDWLSNSSESDALKPYAFGIKETYRLKKHFLDARGEALLALSARFNDSPGDIYGALSTADVEFNKIEIEGKDETITYGAYRRLLEKCKKQEDREKVFRAMYQLYTSKRNTYAAIYEALCQRDWANARARHFDTCAKAALNGDNVPVAVLETLIEVARKGAPVLQKYHKMRAKFLGLEGKYHLYDSSFPLIPNDKEYPFDSVTDWIIDSVKLLGQDYTDKMRRAISSRWIDVYEKEGKRSGAYSMGVYGVHPYMLLNYNDTLDSVFTLAHELGHTLHTVYSNESQPFATSDYTIFVAEVASTTNEGLLLRYLKEQIDSPQERISLLLHSAESIAGTFFTQVLFANWELDAHALIEAGSPANADSLDQLYTSIFHDFYGDAVLWDPEYATTWARIPHFFRSPFYVYQYATCFASSAQILKGIDSADSDQWISRYLDLLRSGGSDHPMEQLRTAGVDLEDRNTVMAVVEQMEHIVDDIENEMAKL